MMSPEKLAEKAARTVCKAHGLKRAEKSEPWTSALGWAMGDGIAYEQAMRELVAATIEIDRKQREKLPAVVNDQIGADYQHGDALIFHPQGGQMSDWTDVVAYDEETDTITRYAYSHADDELRTVRYTSPELEQ
ncbi:hypothetical protein SEA_MARCIE_96 [Microbacterium phage Marcie]|nr:hypothetical protein SEA_MARCIE_96 [Microbacterium phage Marcie]